MLEHLDMISLPSILARIDAELEDKLPNKSSFETFYYVYETLQLYTPRIIFEFICLDDKDSKSVPAFNSWHKSGN